MDNFCPCLGTLRMTRIMLGQDNVEEIVHEQYKEEFVAYHIIVYYSVGIVCIRKSTLYTRAATWRVGRLTPW